MSANSTWNQWARQAGRISLVAAIVATVAPTSMRSSAQSTPSKRPELVLQVGHAGGVKAIALSADGRFLVSGSDDATIKIWDVGTGNVLRTLYGHEGEVRSVALTVDGRLIASGGQDGRVRVWDVTTGSLRTLGAHRQRVTAVAFSTDARQLTSLGVAELKVWDVATSRELHSTTLIDEKDILATTMGDLRATALTPDGRLAAIGGGFSYRGGLFQFNPVRAQPIRVIEAATGRQMQSFTLQGQFPMPTGLRFSRDGRLLVAKLYESETGTGLRMSSSLIVYDVGSGREIHRHTSVDATSDGGIDFSPDNTLFASRAAITGPTGFANSVLLFDVATWRQVRELRDTMAFNERDDTSRDTLAVTPLTFSGDGKLLAMSFGEGVGVFDAASGSRVRVLRTTGHRAAISGPPMGFAFQERMRQSGVDPNEYWDTFASVVGRMDPRITDEPETTFISPITFTPDGKQLVASGSKSLWDTVAGAPRPSAEGLQQALSPMLDDAAKTLSADGTLRAHVFGVADAMAAAAAAGGAAALKPEDVKSNKVMVTDAITGKVVRPISLGTPSQDSHTYVGRLAFNTHGLVVQYCEVKESQDCHVKTFDPHSGRELRDFKLGRNESDALVGGTALVSPGGRFFVSFSMGNPKVTGGRSRFSAGRSPTMPTGMTQPYTMKSTEVNTGRKMWEIKGESHSVGKAPPLTFSPDDAVVAVATIQKEQLAIQVCDTTNGRVLMSVDPGDRTILGMIFSRDSRRLAVTFRSGSDENVSGRPRPPRSGNVAAVYDLSTGREMFELAHETSVNGAAFSPNGRVIATMAEDRHEYLWDANTGEPLATLIDLDALDPWASPEWLVVTPDGLFDGSPGAWQQIMWRFSQNTFDVGPVEIFFNELYPGLAGEIFAGRRPKAPRDLQQIDRRQPQITLTVPAGESAARNVIVKIDLAEAAADATHATGSGAKDVRLFRNGTLVKFWRGDVLNGQPRASLETSVPIVAGQNHFTAYAFNRENVKSVDTSSTVVGSATLGRKGTAYVLAVGVNQYENAEYNLKFAVADATAFAAELKTQQAKLEQFDRVEVIELLDRDATKANLLLALKRLAGNTVLPPAVPSALARLSPAQPEDAVFIYFAGHGTARGARFYLVPHDLGYRGARASLDASAVETILGRSVSDLELEAAVEGLDAGSLVLVVDACNSGQALEADEKRRGPMNSKGLAQLAYEKGMYILTAAESYQAALETSQLGHGYLTFTLVEEGLKQTLADRAQNDGLVSVREWFDYATTRVPELQQSNTGSRLLLAIDDKPENENPMRHLQSPRAFYRSGVELLPLIVGKRQ